MLDNLSQSKTIENIATTKITSVPYYSQSLDCLNTNGEINKFWFRRSCGLICAKMVIDGLADAPEKSIVKGVA